MTRDLCTALMGLSHHSIAIAHAVHVLSSRHEAAILSIVSIQSVAVMMPCSTRPGQNIGMLDLQVCT